MYRSLLLTAQTQRPVAGWWMFSACYTLRMYMQMHWVEKGLQALIKSPHYLASLRSKIKTRRRLRPCQASSVSVSIAGLTASGYKMQQNHILMLNRRVVLHQVSQSSGIWSQQISLHVASIVITIVDLERPGSYGQTRYHLSSSLWQHTYQVTVLACTQLGLCLPQSKHNKQQAR